MSCISLRSNNYPKHYVRHQAFRVKITELASPLDRDDASFRIVDGKYGAGGGLAGFVSLESKNFPGHFIRHRDFHAHVDKFDGSELFAKDCTFRMVVGLADPTGFSFESVNFPGHFLRHSAFLLELAKYDGSDIFKKDATFHLEAAGGAGFFPGAAGGVTLRSVNFPTHYVRHREFKVILTERHSDLDHADSTFHLVDGVASAFGGMRAGYVSLRSSNFPDRYLRHRGFEGYIEPNDGGDLFAKDATFKIVSGLANPSAVSFESVNFPGHFLRHSGFKLRLDKFDGADLFRNDATFFLEDSSSKSAVPAHAYGAPVYINLRSFNFPSHALRHQGFRAKITEIHSELDRNDAAFNIVDGLFKLAGGRVAGAISFQSKNFPNRYLRHRGFELWLDESDGSELFAKDATFRIVPGLEDPRSVSFESVNFPGHYLRHSAFMMRLDKYDGAEIFRKDASFNVTEPSSGATLPITSLVGYGLGVTPTFYHGHGGGAGGAGAVPFAGGFYGSKW